MIRTATLALVCIVPLAAQGARPGGPPAERGATKHSSSTHRVVVINGETVVDEKTVDGKPVRPDRAIPDAGDPDAMLDDLLRRMRTELPPEARGLLDRGLIGRPGRDAAGSSHTRRVVVRNGERIVDEETRDGVPVRRTPVRGADVDRASPTAHAEAYAAASDSASSTDSATSSSTDAQTSGTPIPPGGVPTPPGTAAPKVTPPVVAPPRAEPPKPPAGGLRPRQPLPVERPGGRPIRTAPPGIR